jgi:oxygen-independent coproporphyrinogen-3 oxidase
VAEAQQAIEASLECVGQGSERVIYVHLPFCRSLCSFCGYFREIPAAPDTLLQYAAAVRRQLAAFAPRTWTRSRPFSAIHFGGGTPTLLPGLDALIRDVAAALPLAKDAEITVESTVSDLEDKTLGVLVAGGMNRMALGVQSFDSDRRRSLGRHSSREAVLARIAQARAAGVANVCVDLLYGLPGQAMGTWQADLNTAGTCGATGVSVYPLVPFPTSALGQKLAAERRDSFVDLATEYALFMAADRSLVERPGWTRFSPVQYGDAKAGTAAYVTASGRGAEVLALGAGAAGSMNSLSYLNTPNVEQYLRGWNQGGRWPMTAGQSNDAHAEARCLHALGETTRLSRTLREPAFVNEIIGNLVELGLAQTDAQGASLTPAGCFWAGNICEIFSLAVRDESGRS